MRAKTLQVSDERAFETTVKEYTPLMLNLANRILHDNFLAEDAVSEALIRLARFYSNFTSPVCPEMQRFIVVIIRSASIDLLRVERRRREYMHEGVFDEEKCVSHDAQALGLYEAISQLPPDYGTALLLKFGVGLSNTEISGCTGFSVSKIEKLICRGKRKLEKILEGEGT